MFTKPKLKIPSLKHYFKLLLDLLFPKHLGTPWLLPCVQTILSLKKAIILSYCLIVFCL